MLQAQGSYASFQVHGYVYSAVLLMHASANLRSTKEEGNPGMTVKPLGNGSELGNFTSPIRSGCESSEIGVGMSNCLLAIGMLLRRALGIHVREPTG